MTHAEAVIVKGTNGTTWEPEPNGGMPVNIQDQTTEVLDVFVCRTLEALTLAQGATIDTYTVELAAGHSATPGNLICFKEGTHFLQAEMLSVETNTVTLDRPLDYSFTTAASLSHSNRDLNVDGSVTPVVFRVAPSPLTVKFDVTGVIFHIQDNTAMDDSLFGGIAELTRGVVIRKRDGSYKSICNVKTNGQISQHFQASSYDSKAPAGEYGFTAIKSFGPGPGHGVVIRLDPADTEELQVIVQDDLTALASFRVIALGHVVQD